MIAKCTLCNGSITFTKKQAGTDVQCPHCNAQTTLPPSEPVNWRKRIRNTLFVLAPLLVVAAVFLLVLVIIPWSERFSSNIVQQIFAIVATLAIGTVAVFLIAAWLFFPIIVIVKFNEVIREMVKKRS